MIKSYPINLRFFVIIALGVLLVEIAGFIFVGEEIGILATLSLVVLTAIIGIILLRIKGLNLLSNIQNNFLQGYPIENYVINDILIIIGAILLIFPGFVSDILGISLLIKPIHTIVWYFFSSFSNKNNTYTRNDAHTKNESTEIIELKTEDNKIYGFKESPWNKK
ncbi:FxsA family protein [Bartonella sp. B10]